MDYYFVEPENINNLSNKNGRIKFTFVPQERCNFFEASLVVNLEIAITKKPNITEIPKTTPIQSLKKFFLYGLFSDATLLINKKKFAVQENIFDYVRSNYLFDNDPRDGIYGMKDIELSDYFEAGFIRFNIPLRFLFSEFKGQNYIDERIKELEIKLQENESHVFTSLNESLNFDYAIRTLILKVPKFLNNNELTKPIANVLWKNLSNVDSIEHIVNAKKGDIDCFSTVNRPMNFICFFKDEYNNITNEAASVRLLLNNEMIPKVDMDDETELDHYYELYLRYIDYTYGEVSTEKHEKIMTVLSYQQFKSAPIYYFILPNIKEVGHYSVKLKLKFNQLNTKLKTKSVFYMINYIEENGSYC